MEGTGIPERRNRVKDSRFRGWKDVFAFTFRQMTKKKSFGVVTGVVAVLLVAAIMLVMVLTGKPDEDVTVEPSKINTAYVVDEYGVDYAAYLKALQKEAFYQVDFKAAANCAQAIADAQMMGENPSYVVVEVRFEDGTFYMEGTLPENSSANEDDAEELLSAMSECFEYARMEVAGLSTEQSMVLMVPITTDDGKIGEDHSFGMVLVKMLAPMVFGLILYMMLIFYGQDVSREVSVEKTSKLTETLLTSIKPYAMITGKVLAVASAAILQFFFWIACAVAGLVAGNAVAKSMYPGYTNKIFDMLAFLRETFSETAFSPVAVILAILILVLGFLFYCVLAGMAGSMVSKPEDTAQVQAIFQFPIIISFFACYFGVLLEKDGLIMATRFIPFTIPFGVPVDLLTGAVGITQGVISLVILAAFTILCILLSGRMYEGLILYNGQKLTPKKVWNIICAKRG